MRVMFGGGAGDVETSVNGRKRTVMKYETNVEVEVPALRELRPRPAGGGIGAKRLVLPRCAAERGAGFRSAKTAAWYCRDQRR